LQHSRLKESIQKIAEDLKHSQFQDVAMFYTLGRCLLFLNNISNASIAFKQLIAPDSVDGNHERYAQCDMCFAGISDNWFVCMACADTDVCDACMTKYRMGGGLQWCSSHEFLQIQRAERTNGDKRDSPDFSLDEWIENVRSSYI
jgi:hypothetical protein